MTAEPHTPDPHPIAADLRAWYLRHARALPWRPPPGVRQEPYRVWLSEIMLQQTTVKAVAPFFAAFLHRWPTVAALAAADLNDVLAAWAGLGYYARARNLHACARAIAGDHGGRFPETEKGLRALPGVGAYTAAAIASIAFDAPATPLDGNIERVMARLFAVETPLPKARPELQRLAARLTPRRHPGDHAQAMMDVGATICTPKRPACAICPLQTHCEARRLGIAAALPVKAVKAKRPTRHGTAFVAIRQDGAALLRRRPERGLLGGMMEVPSTPWLAEADDGVMLDHAPVRAEWSKPTGAVEHTFTHFHLTLEVVRAGVAADSRIIGDGDYRWVHPRDFAGEALPSVMRKVLAFALPEAGSARGADASRRGAKRAVSKHAAGGTMDRAQRRAALPAPSASDMRKP